MVELPNGFGNALTVNRQTGRAASQYRFSPSGTAEQDWMYVVQLNAATFIKGPGAKSGSYYTFTADYTPIQLSNIGAGIPGFRPDLTSFFVGDEGLPRTGNSYMGRMVPTAANTLVVNQQCQPVTSYPGHP